MKFVTLILLSFTAACVSAEYNPIWMSRTRPTTRIITKVVDMGICNEKYDLCSDGVYLKTLCMVASDLTYEMANTTCTEAGMNLFVINNSKVQKELQDKANVRFMDRDYARLWVNGKKDFRGSWKTFGTGENYIFHDLLWLRGNSNTGQCLSILRHNKWDTMSFQGWTCSGIAWAYCEFIHPSKVGSNTC